MFKEFKYLLKSKRFGYLWFSQIFSQMTVNAMNFLLLAKLYEATGSAIATSFLWVAYALPAIFFGPIGAASVDMIDRRKMLMITNLAQAITVLIYIFTYQHTLFLLYFIVLLYSFFNQFYVPAENAALPSVVPKDRLVQANSLFFITQQLAVIIGFGVAGIMQKYFGFSGSLIVCAVLLFSAFISVSFLPELKPVKRIPKKVEDILTSFFKSIWEGYLFIKDKKTIFYPLMILLMIQAAFAIVLANLPILGISILGVSVTYAGVYIVIPAGIGALIGAYKINKELKSGVRKKTIIERGLLTIGIAGILLSMLNSTFGDTTRLIAGMILVSLIGFGFVSANIPTITFLQENTPEWLRGRVFGNLWFIVTIVTIFPVLFSGVITDLLGIRVVLLLIAGGAFYIGFYMIKRGQRLIEENLNE